MVKNRFRNKWSDKDVETHWDSVADIYIRENNKVKTAHDQRFKEGILKLSISDGMKILNITSRDAEADDYLKEICKGIVVINAEISGGLIKVAKSIRPSAVQVKINNYSLLPFKDGEFNRILTLETLEHVSDPIEFLNELNRVARKKCKMVLSCPPGSSEFSYRVYTFLFGGHGEGPHKFHSPKTVKQMLSLTGWKLIEHEGTLLIPVGPFWLQKLGEKIIKRYKNSWISNLGIRQFFVCERN